MIWLITGVFAVLSILFFTGKGSFLIAGYNTASKEQKKLYDEKKLCRLMGVSMGIIAVSCALQAWTAAPHWLSTAGGILTLADVVLTLFLANSSLVKNKQYSEELTEKNTRAGSAKTERFLKWGTSAFVLILTALVGLMLFTGDIKVRLNDSALQIQRSYWADKEIPLEQIHSVKYLETLPKGTRTNGLGSYRLLAGHFKAAEIGNYIRYTYVKCQEGISLKTDGGIVILNQKTPAETRSLYERIKQNLTLMSADADATRDKSPSDCSTLCVPAIRPIFAIRPVGLLAHTS